MLLLVLPEAKSRKKTRQNRAARPGWAAPIGAFLPGPWRPNRSPGRWRCR